MGLHHPIAKLLWMMVMRHYGFSVLNVIHMTNIRRHGWCSKHISHYEPSTINKYQIQHESEPLTAIEFGVNSHTIH